MVYFAPSGKVYPDRKPVGGHPENIPLCSGGHVDDVVEDVCNAGEIRHRSPARPTAPVIARDPDSLRAGKRGGDNHAWTKRRGVVPALAGGDVAEISPRQSVVIADEHVPALSALNDHPGAAAGHSV